MFDIRSDDVVWPEFLKPIGWGEHEVEPFHEWWLRVGNSLQHLDPRIPEQWVHRHWRYSPYSFIPLDKIHYRLERWSSRKVIDEVYMPGWNLDPKFDYEAHNRFGGTPTAKAMNGTGTWDYPLVVLSEPQGVIDRQEERPDVRYLLIEGHQRRRYLNALVYRNAAAPEHDVFVLELRE